MQQKFEYWGIFLKTESISHNFNLLQRKKIPAAPNVQKTTCNVLKTDYLLTGWLDVDLIASSTNPTSRWCWYSTLSPRHTLLVQREILPQSWNTRDQASLIYFLCSVRKQRHNWETEFSWLPGWLINWLFTRPSSMVMGCDRRSV